MSVVPYIHHWSPNKSGVLNPYPYSQYQTVGSRQIRFRFTLAS